jgi:apolipoprotein N-acyltransferase
MATAFPGTGDQGWLAFGALVPLLVVIERATWRKAAELGFVAGLVFWLATIPWVAPTMVRYGGLPWPLASLILLALAGYLALYSAAFCALLFRRPLRSGTLYVVVAASVWVALEFLRTYLLTGFPWNLLGYSQYRNLPLIQIAAVTGVYGVSFVVIAANVALAWTLLRWRNWRECLPPLGMAGLLRSAGSTGRTAPEHRVPCGTGRPDAWPVRQAPPAPLRGVRAAGTVALLRRSPGGWGHWGVRPRTRGHGLFHLHRPLRGRHLL